MFFTLARFNQIIVFNSTFQKHDNVEDNESACCIKQSFDILSAFLYWMNWDKTNIYIQVHTYYFSLR